MTSPREDAPATLAAAMRAVDLTLADAVILFGSRAQGRGLPTSDWDLLVVEPRSRKRAAGVEVVGVSTEKWTSEAFYGTELAAAVAFYGVPVTIPLPEVGRIRFDEVRAAARRTAQRFWSNGLKRIGFGTKAMRDAAEMYRRKAATSSLLAERHYAKGEACPARAVLVEEWALLALEERSAIMRSAGIIFDATSGPPPSIARIW